MIRILFITSSFLLLALGGVASAGCKQDLDVSVVQLGTKDFPNYDYERLKIDNLSKNKIFIVNVKLITTNNDVMDEYEPKTLTSRDAVDAYSYKFLTVVRKNLVFKLLSKYEITCAYMPDQNLPTNLETWYLSKPISRF
jgi:hypothetical protein